MKTSIANQLEDLAYHYRHGSFRDVCLHAGVLLEEQLRALYDRAVAALARDVVESHRAMVVDEAKLPVDSAKWSLGQLVRVCQRTDIRSQLEIQHPGAPSRMHWSSLEWVSELRNKAAHAGTYECTERDAWVCKMEAEYHVRLFDYEVDVPAIFARAKVFPNFYDALAVAVPLLTADLVVHPKARIRLLGLTLSQAWHTMVNHVIPTFRGGEHPICLQVDFAMLDPEWPGLASLDPLWPIEAQQAAAYIPRAAPEFVQAAPPGLRIRLFKYQHHPTYHGIIVNENVAIGSTCKIRDGRATGTGANYFGVRRESGDIETFLVEEMRDAWGAASHGETDAVLDVSSPGSSPEMFDFSDG